MRTVIGVDPSLRSTGVAVWQEGRVHTFAVPTSPDDGHRVKRERIIAGRVMPWVADRMSGTVAIVEAVHMTKMLTGRTALDLAGLHDVLVYGLHARGVTVGVAVPQGPKIMATGKGNASKPQMVAAAEEQFGLQVGTSDEADAAWLMSMGVVAGGGKVRGWPRTWDQVRADALAKVEWIGYFEADWLKD